MAKGKKQDEIEAVIVKKVIKKAAGHHGGAWKVAYADFVTAMMAFFLLLWLLNVSTDDALEVISSYFDPAHPKIADTRSGAGGVLGGLTMSPEGAMAQNMQQPVQPDTTGHKSDAAKGGAGNIEKLKEDLKKREQERFEKAKAALEKALQEDAELRELAKHLKVDITPEGLRIQIIDQEGKPMFKSGSASMLPETRRLMTLVAEAVKSMPNDISTRGHTDSYQYAPGAKYTNWELSADRANAARRALLEDGVNAARLADVMGKADREPLVPEDPLDARNRRISIILLYQTLEQAVENGEFGADELQDIEDGDGGDYSLPGDTPSGSFQKTPGDVYFP